MTSAPQFGTQAKTQTLGLDANLAALLCYVPCFPVNIVSPALWLATEPRESRFLRFHALQSLTLSAVVVVLLVAASFGGTFLGILIGMTSSSLSVLIALCFQLVMFGILCTALMLFVIGMIKAYAGSEWEIPFVGQIASKFV
jgi:uncharacterized membrane protein